MNKLLTLCAVLLSLGTFAYAAGADADGEVTKIDRSGARVTLKHHGIKNLDMPPMTMSFHVGDPKLLDRINVGDKVHFAAAKVGGSYTVTALDRAP